jgi:hypothetical protein
MVVMCGLKRNSSNIALGYEKKGVKQTNEMMCNPPFKFTLWPVEHLAVLHPDSRPRAPLLPLLLLLLVLQKG